MIAAAKEGRYRLTPDLPDLINVIKDPFFLRNLHGKKVQLIASVQDWEKKGVKRGSIAHVMDANGVRDIPAIPSQGIFAYYDKEIETSSLQHSSSENNVKLALWAE